MYIFSKPSDSTTAEVRFLSCLDDMAAGASILWGNDARCVIEISGGELLEILYNVMQRTVGHDQRAYSTIML